MGSWSINGGREMRAPKEPELAFPSTQTWWACHGVAYFLGVGDPVVAVKIGVLAITSQFTLKSAVRRRLAQIQTSNHEPVQILGLKLFESGRFPTRDPEVLERQLHIEFSHLARFKPGTKGSEWFHSSPQLFQRIAELLVPPEQLDVPRYIAVVADMKKA
jgi:hypothetical protein